MTQQVNFAVIPELTLGWRLQLALDHGEIKHTDIMSKFEVSRQTVSRWCNDNGAPPKKHILEVIAAMCGVSKDWLIDGDPGRAPQPPGAPAQLEDRRKANSRKARLPREDSNLQPFGLRPTSDTVDWGVAA